MIAQNYRARRLHSLVSGPRDAIATRHARNCYKTVQFLRKGGVFDTTPSMGLGGRAGGRRSAEPLSRVRKSRAEHHRDVFGSSEDAAAFVAEVVSVYAR